MKKTLFFCLFFCLCICIGILLVLFSSQSGPRVFVKLFNLEDKKLFAGSGYDSCAISSFDGINWKKEIDCNNFGNTNHIHSFADFNGKLYAGTGWFSSALYSFDKNWRLEKVFDDNSAHFNEVLALQVFNGKIYAGLYPGAKIFEFDGKNWKKNFEDNATHVYDFVAFKNELIAAINPARILAFNGKNWRVLADSNDLEGAGTVFSLAVYKNRLYAGTSKSGNGNGNVFEYDGANWKKIGSGTKDFGHWFDSANEIRSMSVFNDKLFIGTSRPNRSAYVFAFDGLNWAQSQSFSDYTVSSLVVFQGKLYAGLMPSGEVWVFDGLAWKKAGFALNQGSS